MKKINKIPVLLSALAGSAFGIWNHDIGSAIGGFFLVGALVFALEYYIIPHDKS